MLTQNSRLKMHLFARKSQWRQCGCMHQQSICAWGSKRAEAPALHPLDIGGAVSFWDFQEGPGEVRKDHGPAAAFLQEGGAPVDRSGGGIFGPYCAKFYRGSYLYVPAARCGALRLVRELTLVAWIRRHRKAERQCQAIAGIWNESWNMRQYGLFLDLTIHGAGDNVGGHVSGTGGATPGHLWCMEAAIGATEIGYEQWHSAAMSFRNGEVRVFLDGHLDVRPGLNPFQIASNELFSSCGDFTVGAVDRLGEMGNWFSGELGGLAVYDRALDAHEIAGLCCGSA